MYPEKGRRRVVIEGVEPEVDCGRFPAKRVQGDELVVEADIFTDGHDLVSANLLYRHESETVWSERLMKSLPNDRFRAGFPMPHLGKYLFSIVGWVDHFLTWQTDLRKRLEAKQDVSMELILGAQLIEAAANRSSKDTESLKKIASILRDQKSGSNDRITLALGIELRSMMSRNPDLTFATRYKRDLVVIVDPPKARFSSWYELFPRSAGQGLTHGTFKDVEQRLLPYVASMGFDVLYFPPIHPVGSTYRKGRNNAIRAAAEDPGSPWGIGGDQGGHTSIHPQLGTLEDLRSLVAKAREKGIDIALDIAFQVSPDHPYVREHPEWFLRRPDGSIQYAENPPKKYQDIYPFNFETESWQSLWSELLEVFLYWVEQGITIFRVDNPHTKALPFWEWAIAEIKQRHPEVILLSEAFTRPKIMYYLAKAGFTQSYTYFAWRNTKWELTEYFTELTQTPVRDFFRPNVWPNTPDILTELLQFGGRPAFVCRLILAGTLAANYGIYGPAFELQEHEAREEGSEEYLNSEKYEIRDWNLADPDSLHDMIARVNRIRRRNPALQNDHSLRFHDTTSEHLLCYSKTSPEKDNVILTVVNLDVFNTRSGFIELDLEELGVAEGETFQVHDLLSDARYTWREPRNYIELNPQVVPAHVFQIIHGQRRERDVENYS